MMFNENSKIKVPSRSGASVVNELEFIRKVSGKILNLKFFDTASSPSALPNKHFKEKAKT